MTPGKRYSFFKEGLTPPTAAENVLLFYSVKALNLVDRLFHACFTLFSEDVKFVPHTVKGPL